MDFSTLPRSRITKLRAGLNSTGRDLCLGEMCKGKVKPLEDFCRNRHLCKTCNIARVKRTHRSRGRSSFDRETMSPLKSFGCYECGHSRPSHLTKLHTQEDDASAPRLGSQRFICLWCQRLHSKQELVGKLADEKPFPESEEGRMCNGSLCRGRRLDDSCFYRRAKSSKPYGDCKRCISHQYSQARLGNHETILNEKLSKEKCIYCSKKIHSKNAICFDLVDIDSNTKMPNYGRRNRDMSERITKDAQKSQLICCLCGCDKNVG